MHEIKRNVEKMSNYSLKIHLNNYSGRNTRVLFFLDAQKGIKISF
jgi:hypothetical protein